MEVAESETPLISTVAWTARSKTECLPPEEHGGMNMPTTQLDTASPKRPGLRVNCRAVENQRRIHAFKRNC
jgi:hypothetical protein